MKYKKLASVLLSAALLTGNSIPMTVAAESTVEAMTAAEEDITAEAAEAGTVKSAEETDAAMMEMEAEAAEAGTVESAAETAEKAETEDADEEAEEKVSHVLSLTESAGGKASIYTEDTVLADQMISEDGVYQGHQIQITEDSYYEGDVVHVRAIPTSGYYFDGWETEDGGEIENAALASTSFIMPDSEVTLKAKFEAYADQEQTESSFLNLNGVMWYYNTYFGTKFTEIEADLDNLKESGINILGLFCPYNGDPELYDGCDPLDWYDVAPQCGTMDELKSMISAAHDRDMKVICYFVNIYIDKNSEYFKTAEAQYAAGDYDAKECATFYWVEGDEENPPADTAIPTTKKSSFGTMAPFLQDFKTHWEWSETAGAWYLNVWLGGGLNFDTYGAQAASYDMEAFWLDAGLDGFMFDVARPLEKMQDIWVHFPETYTDNDKWLSVERSGADGAEEAAEFGYNAWFNYEDNDVLNDYGRVITGEIDADGLEEALMNSNYAHELGCWTFTWSIWSDDAEENLEPHSYPVYEDDEKMRVQEAALLAGAGITYGCGMYDQYLTWSETLRTNWNRVLKTVNDNAALLPSAGRERLMTESENTSYAMIREAKDGSQTAVLVYNLSDVEQTVTVDLSGTELENGCAFADLYNGGEAAAAENAEYEITLPAYGFAMLEAVQED